MLLGLEGNLPSRIQAQIQVRRRKPPDFFSPQGEARLPLDSVAGHFLQPPALSASQIKTGGDEAPLIAFPA